MFRRSLASTKAPNVRKDVAECYRDIASVQVYGGVIYSDTTNDYFLTSHGIRTPDFFWKTIITANPSGGSRAISWLIPNSATLGSLDSYIASIDELEDTFGAGTIDISAPANVKAMLPAATWPQPSGGDSICFFKAQRRAPGCWSLFHPLLMRQRSLAAKQTIHQPLV